MKVPLRRTNINITKKEYEFIKKDSEEKSFSMSELIRRIIDNYIEEKNNNRGDKG